MTPQERRVVALAALHEMELERPPMRAGVEPWRPRWSQISLRPRYVAEDPDALVACPQCGQYVGVDIVFPHILHTHPYSALADNLRTLMYEASQRLRKGVIAVDSTTEYDFREGENHQWQVYKMLSDGEEEIYQTVATRQEAQSLVNKLNNEASIGIETPQEV